MKDYAIIYADGTIGPRCEHPTCAVQTINATFGGGQQVLGLAILETEPVSALTFWRKHKDSWPLPSTESKGLRLVPGNRYVHKYGGPCIFISIHPDDGAALIMEVAEPNESRTAHFFVAERDELTPA